MIRYALACDNGHDFDSWFPSSASYDTQVERGLVSCPLCGSAHVTKQLMAPSLGRRGSSKAEPVQLPVPLDAPAQPVALLSEREQAIRAMLKAVREHVVQNAEHVGDRFANEARRMHYGEIEHRSIYGEANPVEAQALVEEGIEVHAIPVLPGDRN
jgi:hypothetical protein